MSDPKTLERCIPGLRDGRFSRRCTGNPTRWWSLPELAGRAGIQPRSLRHHLIATSGRRRDSREGGGRPAVVPARIPRAPSLTTCDRSSRKLTPQTNTAETILVVEDQPATAQITRILLESWGYRVLEAQIRRTRPSRFSRRTATAFIWCSPTCIMPGMNGQQLASELLQLQTRVARCFHVGVSDRPTQSAGRRISAEALQSGQPFAHDS